MIKTIRVLIAFLIGIGGAHAQPDGRAYRQFSYPRQDTWDVTMPAARIERLPPDVRMAAESFRGPIDRDSVNGPSMPRFTFARLTAPQGLRQFLFVTVEGSLTCGSAGCETWVFERRGDEWEHFGVLPGPLTGGSFVLPWWSGGYPALFAADNGPTVSLHWREKQNYRWFCFPPTADECLFNNNHAHPEIFRGERPSSDIPSIEQPPFVFRRNMPPDRAIPSRPAALTIDFLRRRFRPESLPPDLRATLQSRFAAEIEDARRHGGSPAIFAIHRLAAPGGLRHFLFVNVRSRPTCEGDRCRTFAFERVGDDWQPIDALTLSDSFAVLPYWQDRYPTLVHRAEKAYALIHWWDNGRYLRLCFPPSEPSCLALNNAAMPHIFAGPIAPRSFD